MEGKQAEGAARTSDGVTHVSGLPLGVLDSLDDCIKLLDRGGRLTYMNRAGCAALGVDPDTGFGQDWLDLLPGGVRDAGEQALAEVLRGETARFLGRSQLPGRPADHWDNLLSPVIDDDGTLTSILVVSRNVTEERATRAALAESQERLALATAVGGLGIWDFEVTTGVLVCDRGWHLIMGRDPEHPVTSIEDFKPVIHPDDVERATEVTLTAAQLVATGEDYTQTFRIVRPDGEVRWVRSAACIVTDDGGVAVRAVGFVIDVTDQVRARERLVETNQALERERALLEQQSREDPLTGLPNRRAMVTELGRKAVAARRTGSPLTVVMIDIDHFKAYNDRYGHPAGDGVLVTFAQCLRDVTRESDFVARYGGEEFVLLLSGTDDPRAILDRLYRALAERAIPHEGAPAGVVTASSGYAVFAADLDRTVEDALKAADEALYRAKATGRGHYLAHTSSS